MITTEDRIKALEAKQSKETTHGTIISRVLTPGGIMWSLGIGAMSMPKAYFNADTIDRCISLAEEAFKVNTGSYKLIPTLNTLAELDALIPADEGAVSLKLWSDSSWRIQIEFQGYIIGTITSDCSDVQNVSREVDRGFIAAGNEILSKIDKKWKTLTEYHEH